MNKFLIAGEIVSTGDEMLVLETVERTPGGDYPDEHDVYFENGVPTVTLGEKAQILGRVEQDPIDPRKLRLTANASDVRDYDKKLDMNIAKVSGKLHRGFEYFPPAEGKRAFGNLLIIVEETFYMRGVILTAPACMKMDREGKFTTGAEIEIQGRIQTRPFESQGEERIALEIVVDPDKTRVLVEAKDYDPFAEYEESLKEAI